MTHDAAAADRRRDYLRGWRYSSTSSNPTLDHLDAKNAPEAEYDGYLDAAAGREKFHLLTCAERGGCYEHPAPGKTPADYV
jgi:hypothetical protein